MPGSPGIFFTLQAMYERIIRPILFLFPPEFIHGVAARLLRLLGSFPLVSAISSRFFLVREPKLEREVFGIRFPNPVGVAAGFDKEAKLYNGLAALGFGFVEIGTVTPHWQTGNKGPRLFRMPHDKALVNRMGMNNSGVEKIAENLRKTKPRVIIGANIGKSTLTPNDEAVNDYPVCFEKLFHFVDYFVLNVSCPNVANLCKLQNKEELEAIVDAVCTLNDSKPSPKPILLKIAPDLNQVQLDEIIDLALKKPISGIIATNTTTARENLRTTTKKVGRIGVGGLSGLPLRQKSTEVIRYVHQKSCGKIPLIGVGGIFNAKDAIEKLEAGASLVQVYTGFVYQGATLARDINRELLKR